MDFPIIEVPDSEKEQAKFKLILIGEMNVGKTSLIQKFVFDNFGSDYEATIGVEFFSKTFKINADIVKIEIWGTAGSERFKSITKNYYKGAKGALIVYDITNKESFDKIEEWISQIKENSNKTNINMLIIGNKRDLDDLRAVPTNLLNNIGKNIGVGVMETSAKDGYNVKEAFYMLVREMYNDVKKKGFEKFNDEIEPGMSLNIGVEKQKKGCCGKKGND